jgi:NADPH:quinone reductase-like Zn-dependent oxidoreductase/thioesterase domain-containing protein/aryl carrier-like protein
MEQSPARSGSWLIFADSQGIGCQLADRFVSQGVACILVEPGDSFSSNLGGNNGQPGKSAKATIDPLDGDHYRRLLEGALLDRNQRCLGVVHLWSLDIAEKSTQDPSSSEKDNRRLGCGSALALIRALAAAALPVTPPLWLVTAGAQPITNRPLAIEQSPLLGLGRVAALELPDLQPRLIDIEPDCLPQRSDIAANLVFQELQNSTTEAEIAYRDSRRFVPRLTRESSIVPAVAIESASSLAAPLSKPFQLRISRPGSFDALRFVPAERQPPQPGQVEIAVHAAGLNFSDVLKALGLYPGIRDTIVPLGIEASGVVTAVGESVDRFRIGDEVFGVVPYAFASHARTAEYALVPKPQSLSHNEACTIPITFLTAYYGLVRLAQLQPGERVLIHAGAGGVGLAAIQIAKQIGATIFATTGSEKKRELLLSLGLEHVYSSRDTTFAAEILADTAREGVDVVLNSLPGETITKSLSILRAYGRFLEIGKTDIYQNRMIGLSPFQDNLSYFAIDLDRMLRQRPEYIRRLFADVMEKFASGHYRPLLLTRFEAEQTVDAFRYMSQRKNVGKVVVALESNNSRVESPEPGVGGAEIAARDPRPCVRRDGTYLITGGLGALGLRVARWLAEQGAGAVALLSRSQPSAGVEQWLTAMRGYGTQVITLSGDVANAESLAAALSRLAIEAPPLRGVVHAAGVLADGVLTDMTLERLERAMSPKVAGAWNLHASTLTAPLDFFILFSSVASVLGSPGQANYAAGNAYLDALAHTRRAQGLSALSINWGPWAEAGMAAEVGRSGAVKSRGMELIPLENGLTVLGQLLNADLPQIAVMNAQWADILQLLGSRRPALLSEIAKELEQAGGPTASSHVDSEFRDRLLAADENTRHNLIADYIRSELARIIGVEPTTLESDQPLNTYGLDSLLALELKSNLERRLAFTLPVARLMEGPSITALATETARLVVASAFNGKSPITNSVSVDSNQQWTPLLALRSEGTRPPLVLLPALGGDVKCYAELVQRLGEDQPVFAFRPRGLDQDLPPHLTMAEMSADYMAAIVSLQPAGPYYLGGWSTGGIFAYALAEALERDGHELAVVTLFDTPLPSICGEVNVEDDARFLCSLVNFANCFAGTNVRQDYDELLALPPEERFQTILADARRQGTIPAEAPESFIRRLVHVGESNVRVIQHYQPRPITAPVHLFTPLIKGGLAEVSGALMPEDEDHGWSAVIGQRLALRQVPGDHFSMMRDEGAAKLAHELAILLRKPTAKHREPAVSGHIK